MPQETTGGAASEHPPFLSAFVSPLLTSTDTRIYMKIRADVCVCDINNTLDEVAGRQSRVRISEGVQQHCGARDLSRTFVWWFWALWKETDSSDIRLNEVQRGDRYCQRSGCCPVSVGGRKQAAKLT